ncbi:MAG: hypothetical protein LBG77_09260 [Dysgonamonadaceae bacterium]|jgi:hypothetical protein|nr:hypothetical protein [Dysgonamonadaceae bacterium]
MKQHFNTDYPYADYLLKNVLKPALGEYKLHCENVLANNPQYKNAAQQSGINKIVRVAEFQVGITPVSVFDITLSDNARISQARVNIQRVVRSLQAVFTGSLMLFHYENGEDKEWRISFMEKGETLTATSMPRRYTYLCGKMHQCRTVGERFEILKKTPEKSVAEILKAFSVETLTKDFYKELFT